MVRKVLGDFIAISGQLKPHFQVRLVAGQLCIRLDRFFQALALLLDFLGVRWIVPEARLGDFLL